MKKIKKLIKKIIKKAFLILPLRNYILLESCPDLSDNTKAVFDEMIRRGLNKKYKMIWICYDEGEKSYPKFNNIKYVSAKKRISTYYRMRAKALLCCNRFLIPFSDKQFSIFLQHGTGIKESHSYYKMPESINYGLAASDWAAEILMKEHDLSKAKIIFLGYPRNDILTAEPLDSHKYFKNEFKKIIVWYPTFRQHRKGGKTGAIHALPVIWDEKKANVINEYAKEKDVLIVLKPHFAQDVSYIKKLDLSNIVFIDDAFFKDNDITSYRFVGSCDALITDFSSIYYDYTLCDKPIGLIWEDYEEYKQNPGFAVDMDYMMKGGVKIYNLEDFKAFIRDIARGVDKLKDERREIRDIANYSTDGKNAERVVDFIIEKAKL